MGAGKINGPQGVRLHRADGTIIECELLHEGVDDDGMDSWLITGVEFHPEHGDSITVDVLPAHTSIGFNAPVLKFWREH